MFIFLNYPSGRSGQQMRDDFFNGPGWQKRTMFSNGSNQKKKKKTNNIAGQFVIAGLKK